MSKLEFGMLMFPVHNPQHDPTVQLEQDVALAEHAEPLGSTSSGSGNITAGAGRSSPTRS